MNNKQIRGFMRDWTCSERVARRYRDLTTEGVFPTTALQIVGLLDHSLMNANEIDHCHS